MKTAVLNLFRRILGLLGFAAAGASCGETIANMACMYGVPTMDYSVSGKVQNASGDPIEGIEVTSEEDFEGARALTSPDGSFTLGSRAFPADTISISFNDVDGVQNGEYKDNTVKVPLKKTAKGDGSWYSGKYEAAGVVVTMEKK